MHRTESEYCRDHQPTLQVSQAMSDPGIRDQVNALANEWVERAVAKGNGLRNIDVGRPELKSA
jgi:hypothetical protein